MKILNVEKPGGIPSVLWDESLVDSKVMIEESLKEVLEDTQGEVQNICFHILKAGGKRIRPLLVWYSGLLFGPGTEDLKRTAIGAELIHMASLVHDDIIDDSEFRHNQPAVQKIWGNHRAVLGGDYLFAKAFGVLAHNKLIKPLEIMVEAIQDMCRGEILQDQEQFNLMIGEAEYYNRITKKTAVLIEASCKAGAVTTGADYSQIEKIGQFGLHLGMAFQIIDDIQDICGDEPKMGKPKYTDLIKGNLTLPVILLLKKSRYYEWMSKIFKEGSLTPPVLFEIEDAVRNSGALREAFEISVSHLERAREYLRYYTENPARSFLENLTHQIQARIN